MKKLAAMAIAAILTVPVIGCKDDGSGIFPFSGGEASEGTAPMQYMEYMYGNENGARLNEMATAGMPDTPEFSAQVARYQQVPLVEYLGVSGEDPLSEQWWKKLDINAEEFQAYLMTDAGKSKVDEYFGGAPSKTISSGILPSVPGIRSSSSGSGFPSFSEPFSYYPEIDSCYYNDYWISHRFHRLDYSFQIAKIYGLLMNDLEEIHYQITNIEGWLKEQNLVLARNTMESKVREFAQLANVDATYRRNLIKDFFTNGYETLYQNAYESAVQRTELLNQRLGVDEKVPGNMLLSDAAFMREMSQLRIAYAPVFYSRAALLRWRANVARDDLARLKQIKDALFSDPNLDNYSDYFNEYCALLASWEITLRAHIETYYGRDVSDIELEDAANIDADRAFGTFGDLNDLPGSGICGKTMSDDSGAPLTGLFNYGDSLESVFDTSTSGSLDGGKFIRMVHSGRNLLSDLGLTPVAKRLLHAEEMTGAPGKGQFFIDPATGRYILPRPDYWSRMESVENITDPDLRGVIDPILTVTSGNLSTEAGKNGFGNCIMMTGGASSLVDLWPFGNAGVSDKGTLSMWWNPNKPQSILTQLLRIYIAGTGTYIELTCEEIKIVVNGSLRNSGEGFDFKQQWNHVYLVWDLDQSLYGELKTIRLFVNGEEIGSCSDVWTSGTFSIRAESHTGIVNCDNRLDNLKIWKHVVSESPDWEFNPVGEGTGLGREKALHAIYGPDSDPEYDYRPHMTGSGNGVGYFFLQ